MKWKVAIVTGGERGIGRAISERLLREGMVVCIAGIDHAAAAHFCGEMGNPEKLIFIEADTGNEETVKRVCTDVVNRFGRIDVVVANAAIADAGSTPVEDLELAQWERAIRTNLTGCFLYAKYSFAELRKQKGSMILIASTRAGQSEPNTVAYSASKGGVVALAHSLAMSGGPEIRVNCISPGWIYHGDPADLSMMDHQQHPVGRVGRPDDIAGMVSYLVSDEAGFITGQNFIVDGGMTRRMIHCG